MFVGEVNFQLVELDLGCAKPKAVIVCGSFVFQS